MNEIDTKIDWKEFYGKYIQNLKKVGTNKMQGLCPFHNDSKPSFWFNTINGCYKCESCGETGNGQKFLEKAENIDNKEAYKKLLKVAGEYKEPVQKEKFTLQHYSELKQLPLDFLKDIQIENNRNGIVIPYFDAEDNILCKRNRYGSRMFSWSKGSKVNLYGLWKLKAFKESKFIVLVEGESDSQTLWFHNIPALGVPGASTFQVKWVEHIKDFNVYIHKEPDRGGETFLRKTCEALFTGGFKNEVYEISIPGCKDPSELHLNSSDEFDTKWNSTISAAIKIDIEKIIAVPDVSIPNAPVILRIPTSFKLSEEGIFMLNDKSGIYNRFCRTPILISKRLVSVETNEEKLEIAFQKDGDWHKQIVQRSTLFQSRTIIQLSDIGINVTSENAKFIVKFLGALLDENMDLITISKSVIQMGWHDKSFMPYLAEDLVLDVDSNSRMWVDAYRQVGTFEGWQRSMREFRTNHIFRFLLSCSFAAPLLKILNHRIFMVHNWGNTRFGKTAALKAALSVWGDPEGLMGNFNATKVGLEKMASFFTDLPLGIDEKQVAGNKQDLIESIVYMLSLGKSKVRGTKSGGMQNSSSWRSIILTTGEEPIIVSNSQGGINTRVVEIYGAPFSDESSARNMHELSILNYGYSGAVFLETLIKDNRMADVRNLYGNFAKHYQSTTQIGTHISNVALIAATDTLVSEIIFGLNKDESREEALIMGKKILSELSEQQEDVNDKVYDFITEWAISNKNQFGNDAKPSFGFLDGRTFYIFPSVLEEVLTKRNYSYRKTIRALGEKRLIGISFENGKERYSVTRRFNGNVSRFIEVRFKELEESTPF